MEQPEPRTGNAGHRDLTERQHAAQERGQQAARAQALLACSQQLLAEQTLEGLMQRVIDAACELADARFGVLGHIYRNGTVFVGATSPAADASSSPGNMVRALERGMVYFSSVYDSATLRLGAAELHTHPAWQGVPEGHRTLRGMLGARLMGRDGQPNGLIMLSDRRDGSEFTANDEVILGQLAAMASLALQQVEARQEAERRTAELEGLMEENRRQHQILESWIAAAPIGVVVVRGAEHRFEVANPYYRTTPGVPDVPLVGHTLAEVFPESVARRVSALYDEVHRTGQTVHVPEWAGEPGTPWEGTYWAADHVPLHGANGQVEGVLSLLRNVTKHVHSRQQIERVMAELADERARLDAIIHNAPEGIVMTDAQGRILLTNPTADRLHARPAPYGLEYASHAELQFCHVDGTPYDPHDLPLPRSALYGETWHEVELGIVWPDGQRRSLLANTAPIRSTTGEILGAVGVFQDITERKQTREALRQARDSLEERVLERTRELVDRTLALQRANADLQAAEEQLRAQHQSLLEIQRQVENERRRYQELFHFAPDGYLVTDQDGHILEANRAAGDLLELRAEELPGRELSSLVFADDAHTFTDALRHLRAGMPDVPLRWEMRLQPPEGEAVHVAVSVVVSRTVDGEIEGLRWLLRDVTRENELHTALVHAEKLSMAGQLAASLAHEINNPLSAAIGCVELVREALDDGQDPSPLLDTIRVSLRRTARIVSQLRELHRRSEVEKPQEADLNELVENVLLLAGKKARSAGVEISWERVQDLPGLPLMVDGIQQVFLNLVINAVDAMENGGHLSVRVRRLRYPARVGVEFADTGPGIAPAILEQMFQPFRTTKAGGSGLGLFISKNIVQQHGGTISVESVEGQGTTFTVWLPTERSRMAVSSPLETALSTPVPLPDKKYNLNYT